MIPMGLKVLQDKNPVQYKKENNIVLTSKIVRSPPTVSSTAIASCVSVHKWNGAVWEYYETKNWFKKLLKKVQIWYVFYVLII